MDESELFRAANEDRRVPGDLVGRFLGELDWGLAAECTELVVQIWRRRPEFPELRMGGRYLINPSDDGTPAPAALVLVIPDDPDAPTASDGFGLWQLREPDRALRWLLLADTWMDRTSVRPIE